MIFGTAIGLIAGYHRGIVDLVLMRVVDIQLAMPFILMALTFIAIFGPGLPILIILMIAAQWVQYARLVRGLAMSLREREFVQSARAIGVRSRKIILVHILPNAIGPIIVLMTLNVANNILLESSLTFVGLGVDPTVPSWGGMLADGRTYVQTAWWVTVFPGLAIMFVVLGLNLIGDWLRDLPRPAGKKMTDILDFATPRTLDVLVARYTKKPVRGPVEAWLFEDGPARRQAEKALAAAGVTARFRSAYKPLVHFFLEEADLAGVTSVEVRYPRHKSAPYRPLSPGDLSARRALSWRRRQAEARPGGTDLRCHAPAEATARPRAMPCLHRTSSARITSASRCSPIVAGYERRPATGPIATEFEALFWKAVETVGRRFDGKPRPPFDRLRVEVEMPAEMPAAALLEGGHQLPRGHVRGPLLFDSRASRRHQTGDGEKPGRSSGSGRPRHPVDAGCSAASPDARTVRRVARDGRPRYEACTDRQAACRRRGPQGAGDDPRHADRGSLARGPRDPRRLPERQGPGRADHLGTACQRDHRRGRCAPRRTPLSLDPDAHFAVVPLENVDGYELHQRLIVDQPEYMHHAARFSALGDDLWFYPKVPVDQTARVKALELSGAGLHLNLHGYPAHEWTRPLTGYLPKGYELWTLPKGFFLIIDHHPGWKRRAFAMMEEITAALSADQKLVAFNARQIEIAFAHMRRKPFAVMNGFPYLIAEGKSHPMPLTLITEAPDETIYGEDFVLMQTAQMNTVIHAVRAYRGCSAAAGAAVARHCVRRRHVGPAASNLPRVLVYSKCGAWLVVGSVRMSGVSLTLS